MHPQKTVLLADDDRSFLLTLTQRRQNLGIQVKTAEDGLETLLVIAKDAPELLILDYKLCERLGETMPTSGTPIIILTSSSQEEASRRCTIPSAQFVRKDAALWDHIEPIICEHLDIAPAQAHQPSKNHEVPHQTPTGSTGPKILVIDDDPQITKALMIRLTALGLTAR